MNYERYFFRVTDVCAVLRAHGLYPTTVLSSDTFLQSASDCLCAYESRVADAASRSEKLYGIVRRDTIRSVIEDILMETKFIRTHVKLFPGEMQ